MIKSKSIKTILFSIFSFLIFVILFYLVVNLNKPVTIVVDGIEITTRTSGETVGDVLEENDIVLQDGSSVFPSRHSKVDRGEKIILENPVPVILYLGKMDPYEVMTISRTVGDFLQEQGVEVDEGDIITPSIDTLIVPDMEIYIKYVDIKVEQEQHEIGYETKINYNDNLYEGNEKVVQEGKSGLRVIKREKCYENGIEVDNKVIYDNVEIQPVQKIVERGTKKKEVVHFEDASSRQVISSAYENGNKINFLGKEYSIAYTKSVEATAFYNSGSNGNHTTATGNPTVYNPKGWSTIAVDPKVIPLNTKVYVEGYGFGIAHDTGGAIKGNIIDVFMPSRDAAYTWGRKKGVKIYILE